MALAVAIAVTESKRFDNNTAASKATKKPCEWPIKCTLLTFAASKARTNHAPMASMLVNASPADKLWAGMSGANTL